MTSQGTLSEMIFQFNQELKGIYPKNEIRNICYLVSEHLLNYSKIDFHLRAGEPISSEKEEKLLHALKRLKNHEPVQYVTGRTEFLGLDFRVDSRVLIPRPETAELVDWILRDEKAEKILDIGTGSGCIAVTLATRMKETAVSACDVSDDALDLARENAQRNGANIAFFRYDILQNQDPLPGKYDLIISNPPYVCTGEKPLMQRNVLDYEPSLALFVPNSDPLVFYRQIVLAGRRHLNEGGRLYFEINERFPDEVVRLMSNSGFFGIEVRHDLNGKARMVRGRK